MEFTDNTTEWVTVDEESYSKYCQEQMGFFEQPVSKKNLRAAVPEVSLSSEGQKEVVRRKKDECIPNLNQHAIPGRRFGANESDQMSRGFDKKMVYTDNTTGWVTLYEDPFPKYRQEQMGSFEQPVSKPAAMTEVSLTETQRVDTVTGERYMYTPTLNLHAIPEKRFGANESDPMPRGFDKEMVYTDNTTEWVTVDEDPLSKYCQEQIRGSFEQPVSKPAMTEEVSLTEGKAGGKDVCIPKLNLHAIPGRRFGANEIDLMSRLIEIMYEKEAKEKFEYGMHKVG